MRHIETDILIVGGGPAGLAAAVEADEKGAGSVLIIERDTELGGILPQCIHDGFGIHEFGKRLTGPQYAQMYTDRVAASDCISVELDTMVLEITQEKTVYACNSKEGILEINAKAIILAMGCRERTAAQVLLYGYRPAGVLTAGSVQRYINREGYLPGSRAVILGSGDIGLIMARRMTLEGIEVEGVYEKMPEPGGLTRNIVQCLEDYDIPMHLSTTVVRIHGKYNLEGVTVAEVDSVSGKILEDSKRFVPCDLLVLAVGLIPENELSKGLGISMDEKTGGPLLDERFMTSVPGVFAAGNVAAVFDLVDYVAESGRIAARGAVGYIQEEDMPDTCIPVEAGDNIRIVLPQRVSRGTSGKVKFFIRVQELIDDGTLRISSGEDQALRKKFKHMRPPEMLVTEVELINPKSVCVSIEKPDEANAERRA